MAAIPDLVRVSKLDTQFCTNPEYTQHVQYVSGTTFKQRKIRKEERWEKDKRLGRGSYGVVWLERCIHGDSEGKYEHCFVKSFGWYDNLDSIFIAMEYLPHGDLHKYLSSPLPERDAQHIVAQVLEGLNFMHENRFAHRDLKPANILVVCRGPDWWVKIADFGISKRAIEGLTALRTLTGTPAFAAPEVLGFVQSDDNDTSYTKFVDIWSLSVIAFLILTGKTLFGDQRCLGQYVKGLFAFPSNILLANDVSEEGRDFVKTLMAPNPKDRPDARSSLEHPWFSTKLAKADTSRITTASESPSYESDTEALYAEPSAIWSTEAQTLPSRQYINTGVRSQRADSESSSSKNAQYPTSTHEPQRSTEVLSTTTTATPVSTAGKTESVSGSLIQNDWGVKLKLKGHSDWVYGVAFSPDGRLIASASRDKTVRLWDPATGAACGTLKGPSGPVHGVAFSPGGRLIASASRDKTVRLWDPATGAACGTLKGHSDLVYSVAFSPDGRLIASASEDKTVRLWDPATGAACGTLNHPRYVFGIAFSPNSKLIASALDDHTVMVWN